MNVESLLNTSDKFQMMYELTDKDFFQVVMDAVEAHKNMEHDGGDDLNDEVIVKHPSPCEVLKVAAAVNRYIEDLNDPMT
jgi:hypothetical protein